MGELPAPPPGDPPARGLIDALGELVPGEGQVPALLALLRATLDATPDAVLLVDLEGSTLFVNQPYLTMWQMPAGQVGQREAERLAHIRGRALLVDPEGSVNRVVELHGDPEAEYADELAFVDGRVVERLTRPVRIGGAPVGRVWMFRDVTIARRAQREREHLQRRLHEAQKLEAVGALAGGFAHDVNNMLTCIDGCAQELDELLPGDHPGRAAIADLHDASVRAAELTRQLLAIGRRQELRPRRLSPATLVPSLVPLLERATGARIQLRVRMAADLGLVIADPSSLQHAILNLVVNARDAIPGAGTITIEGANRSLTAAEGEQASVPAGDYVALAVTDDGTGMDEATLRRIFEPFFTTKPEGKGTGLGLPTVHGTIAQSGGGLRVTSRLGAGTRVEILLPRAY